MTIEKKVTPLNDGDSLELLSRNGQPFGASLIQREEAEPVKKKRRRKALRSSDKIN